MLRRVAALLSVLLPTLPLALAAQLEPPSTGGAPALDQSLRFLGHHQRVLLIAAHPDDEDTELLTLLARGMGAEAAYLSLNRGEGGQNLIGSELGPGLGLLRTEELLAARRLDGARQYFTRAYDFGYSKNLDDTWAHWPRDSVLKDVVRVVRRFRPQVVVSIFSGTPRDGHGQHQAAGWAAAEAFRVAGDSARFPELLTEEGLPAFAPFKLYRSTRFDSAATSLTLDGGVLDPVVGQSFHQIAMRGRSLHRSQDMGQLQRMGPSAVRVRLVEDRTGAGEGGLFGGVDTTLGAAGAWDPANGATWSDVVRAVERARAARGDRAAVFRALLAARSALLRALPTRSAGSLTVTAPSVEQAEQDQRLQAGLAAASDVLFDAVTDDERVVPGQELEVLLTAWNAGARSALVSLRLDPPAGWSLALASAADDTLLPPGGVALRRVRIRVAAEAPSTRPYFDLPDASASLYQWPKERAGRGWFSAAGLPAGPPPLTAVFGELVDGALAYQVTREVAARWNDQARGEIRRPLSVVPRVDVKLDPATEVWPAGAPGSHELTVTLTHGARDTTSGRVALELPAGWPAVPPQPFRLTREDEHRRLRFRLRAPAGLAAGSYPVRAVATDVAGRRYDAGVLTVDYPHIRPRPYSRAAGATVHLAPLALPRLQRVAYIRGAADRVPEALAAVGVPIELLTGAGLGERDLKRYDAIVIGPRAWETDADLPGNSARLLAYAQGGGRVIVQYQQYGYFLGNYAPYPLTVGSRPPGTAAPAATTTGPPAQTGATGQSGTSALLGGHDRVTDETAGVVVLNRASALLRVPNRIGPADWAGWVQERGLYFAHSWDPAWRPVLSLHDPGEAPLEGGLLVARVGRGVYIYTGLSFFRQLPAGVPGAYRLFANLLGVRGRE